MTVEKVFPDEVLTPRASGNPLTLKEILLRWEMIVVFFRLNQFYPNTSDLMYMWSATRPNVLNTLRLLDGRGLIKLHLSGSGVQMGVTGGQQVRGFNALRDLREGNSI